MDPILSRVTNIADIHDVAVIKSRSVGPCGSSFFDLPTLIDVVYFEVIQFLKRPYHEEDKHL
jgi:hypothetical protein